MLTERLKSRELHEDLAESAKKHEARVALNSAVRELITLMSAIERDGTYTRTEIENFVLNAMEHHEVWTYSMSNDEFDEYLDNEMFKAMVADMRRMR